MPEFLSRDDMIEMTADFHAHKVVLRVLLRDYFAMAQLSTGGDVSQPFSERVLLSVDNMALPGFTPDQDLHFRELVRKHALETVSAGANPK